MARRPKKGKYRSRDGTPPEARSTPHKRGKSRKTRHAKDIFPAMNRLIGEGWLWEDAYFREKPSLVVDPGGQKNFQIVYHGATHSEPERKGFPMGEKKHTHRVKKPASTKKEKRIR